MTSAGIVGIFAILVAILGIVIMSWNAVCYVLSDKHIYEDYAADIAEEEEESYNG